MDLLPKNKNNTSMQSPDTIISSKPINIEENIHKVSNNLITRYNFDYADIIYNIHDKYKKNNKYTGILQLSNSNDFYDIIFDSIIFNNKTSGSSWSNSPIF
jgi:hypothetical protein